MKGATISRTLAALALCAGLSAFVLYLGMRYLIKTPYVQHHDYGDDIAMALWLLPWAALSVVIGFKFRRYLQTVTARALTAVLITAGVTLGLTGAGWIRLLPGALAQAPATFVLVSLGGWTRSPTRTSSKDR